MRNALVIFIIASVIGIAVFGFLGMGGHRACIAATFEGMPACPAQGVGFDDALFHIETFKSFSQAVSVAAMALLALSVLTIAMVWFAQAHLQAITASTRSTMRLEEIRLRSRKRIQRWLTLHEKRDPASVLVGAD